jgi:DNA polymerase (family 10)
MKSYNDDFYNLFYEIGELMGFFDENIFRIRAYQQAARRIKMDMKPITKKDLIKEKLMEMPGIGKAIAEKMIEYGKTGKIEFLEELRRKIPKPVRELLKVPHLGPRRVKDLYINLGIKTKADLIKAAKSGAMDDLPGFGPKLVRQILEGIKSGQEKKKRHDRAEVEPIAERLVEILKGVRGVKDVVPAGSFRRQAETVGDLDILVSGEKAAKAAAKAIYSEFRDVSVLASGETKIAFVIFPQNLQVDIRFVPKDSWGAALLYFTGSKEYNVMMRKVAIGLGYLLNEYGVFKDGEYIAGKTEKEVCDILKLPYLDPNVRK